MLRSARCQPLGAGLLLFRGRTGVPNGTKLLTKMRPSGWLSISPIRMRDTRQRESRPRESRIRHEQTTNNTQKFHHTNNSMSLP